MPVPREEEICKALLEALDKEHPRNLYVKDFMMIVARSLRINIEDMSPAERADFRRSIDQAKAYLMTNNLISNPAHNVYMITSAGKRTLNGEAEEPTQALLPDATPLDDLLPQETPEADTSPDTPEAPEVLQHDTPTQDLLHNETTEAEPSPDTPEVPEVPQHDAPTQDLLHNETTEAEPSPETPEAPEVLQHDTSTEDLLPQETPEAEPSPEAPQPETQQETPEEYEVNEDMQPQELNEISATQIEEVLAEHNAQLAAKVLARTTNLSPSTFEVFVTDLLSKMGYKAFHNARYTSDDTDNGMIHGLILDPSTVSPLYIHAVKLSPDQTVGRADIQDFVDALADKGGKGIFATTALFSDSAEAYAQDERILLIDGPKLATLMISHNFCVNVEKVFEVKELDEDSFIDYES